MSTLTPNYGLIVPEGTDTVEQVRADYATNLNTIDGIGGGGSGGHTIVNENGTDMPAEGKLQFTGGVTVTDDSVNGKTVVDISGGGGNVYGAFIDTNRLLVSETTFRGSMSYTAIEDCFVVFYIVPTLNDTTRIKIDGKDVSDWWRGTLITDTALIPVKKGQILSVTNANTSYDSSYIVYGITQGTNGIFTPIIYSDNERVVGVWRDNKPLYQKTTHIGAISANASSAFSVGVGANVVDTMVSYNVIAYVSSGAWVNLPQPLPSNISSYASYVDNYNKANDTINIITGADRDFSDAFVTVQYTKTTDVAGSGNWNTDGVPTVHYSTSEQVIGTWLNGKPLYEISFEYHGNINANATTVIADLASLNIDDFVSGVGTGYEAGWGWGQLPANGSFIRYDTTTNKLQVQTASFALANTTAYFTIRYTKVTD